MEILESGCSCGEDRIKTFESALSRHERSSEEHKIQKKGTFVSVVGAKRRMT